MAGAVAIVALSTQPVMLLGAGSLQIGRELGFGPAGLGALTAAFFLVSAAASAPAGRVVARIGWQYAMRLNAVGSGAILLTIAVAAKSTAVLVALLVVGGLFYGLANPAANQSLSDHVAPERRGVVFGLKHAGIPVSTLLAGLAVPSVIVHFGWRAAYLVSAALTVVVLLLVPRSPVEPTAGGSSADPRRFVAPMSDRLLVGLALMSSLATWGAVALSTYLVAAAVDVGFTESAAGFLLFTGSVSSLVGRVAVGAHTDRIGGRGFGGLAVLLGIGSLVFWTTTVASGWAFAVLVVGAFVTGWGWPGLMTYTVVNANARSTAASSAITQAGTLAGAGAGPIVLGWVVDTWSFDAAFVVVGVTSALAAFGVLLVGRLAAGATDVASRTAGGTGMMQ